MVPNSQIENEFFSCAGLGERTVKNINYFIVFSCLCPNGKPKVNHNKQINFIVMNYPHESKIFSLKSSIFIL